ncbi:MAG: capsule assembly Wzi family protein [Hydrogenothermaceae bacterium]
MLKYTSKIFTITFLTGITKVFAVDNLFIPLNDFNFYNYNLNLSNLSSLGTTTLKPFTCEKAKVFLNKEINYCKDPKFIKRVYEDIYYTSFENTFSIIPEYTALKLAKGFNNFSTLEGDFSLHDVLNFQYQLRYSNNSKTNEVNLFKATFSLKLDNTILTFGKDNIKVGPSKYGNLLSAVNPPYYQIRIQNLKPLEFHGLWDWLFMYGYLKEDRLDHSNPSLFFLRLDYKPNELLEIGINRMILFGGEGRPTYKFYEYPKVFIGTNETTGNRFDNDSYLGYDIKLNIPIDKVDTFQIYYENNATDLESPLKKGDPKKLYFPLLIVKFHDNAHTLGLRVKKDKYYLNWEYTSTGKTMYINHNYPYEGLSYKGFILGYPYGRSVVHSFIEFGIIENEFSNFFEIGYLKQPVDINTNIGLKDYYFKYRLIWAYNKKVSLSPYIKIDKFVNYNLSYLANQFDIIPGNKTAITTGVSILWNF